MTTLETLTELVDAYGMACVKDGGYLPPGPIPAARLALDTAIAAVVRDAERLDWLIDQQRGIDLWNDLGKQSETVGQNLFDACMTRDKVVLRAAIDAALKASWEG